MLLAQIKHVTLKESADYDIVEDAFQITFSLDIICKEKIFCSLEAISIDPISTTDDPHIYRNGQRNFWIFSTLPLTPHRLRVCVHWSIPSGGAYKKTEGSYG